MSEGVASESSPRPPSRRDDRLASWVIAALLLAWGAVFIARSSFVLDGTRTFCLIDDAMISMAYARNLVEGRGLQWGQSPNPVEGFTHPLWLAVMAATHLTRLPAAAQSLPVQCLALALLLANLWAVQRLVERHFLGAPAGVAWPAVLLTAGFYPLAHWSLLGMEVGLQALLVVSIVDAALDLERGESRARRLALLLVAAVLLRMDMALVWLCVLAFLLPSPLGGRGSRVSWRQWTELALWPALALGLYQLFRWSYFHDLLPNTYALKLAGIPLLPRLERGLAAWWDFALPRAPLLLAALGGALVLGRSRRAVRLPLALVLVGFLYAVYVGGDAWERMDSRPENDIGANRFVAFLMPLCFVLVGAGWNAVADRVPRRRVWLPIVTALAWLCANGLLAPSSAAAGAGNLLWRQAPRRAAQHQRLLDRVRRLEAHVPADALVAVVWAGIPGYFSNLRLVDALGYNDRRIARQRPRVPLEAAALRPGHVKWDWGYVLNRRRVDAVLQLWPLDQRLELESRLERSGFERVEDFWVRREAAPG